MNNGRHISFDVQFELDALLLRLKSERFQRSFKVFAQDEVDAIEFKLALLRPSRNPECRR